MTNQSKNGFILIETTEQEHGSRNRYWIFDSDVDANIALKLMENNVNNEYRSYHIVRAWVMEL